MWVFHLHVHLCTMSVQCLWRPEKNSYPLCLELRTIVSGHMGAGNRTWVLGKSSQCLTTGPSLQPESSSYWTLNIYHHEHSISRNTFISCTSTHGESSVLVKEEIEPQRDSQKGTSYLKMCLIPTFFFTCYLY